MSEESDNDRLRRLNVRLRDARHDAAEKGDKKGQPLTGIGLAFRVGVELLSAVAVGGAIGWGLDLWLETRPWLMLVLLLLGGAAGILNVYRISSGYSYAAGYKKADDAAGDSTSRNQGNQR